jgi:hypothetical protein
MGVELRSLTLRAFENTVVLRIFRPKNDEVADAGGSSGTQRGTSAVRNHYQATAGED